MLKNAKIISRGTSQLDYFKEEFKRGDPKFVASSSMLRLFGPCPSRWIKGYQPPDTKAKDFGSLFDCRVLTPETFTSRYAVSPSTYKTTGMECPSCKTITDSKKCKTCGELREEVTVEKPWNSSATVCKEWEADHEGKQIVTTKALAAVDAARNRLLGDDILKSFLESSERQIWMTVEWHDEATGLVIPMKSLIDLLPKLDSEFEKCIGDIKAVRSGATVPFKKQVAKMGWHIQAALYLDVYKMATGEDRVDFCFLGVENFEPYEPYRKTMSEKFLSIGRSAYETLLKRYCQCLKANVWPSYDDTKDSLGGWTLLEPEPWMEYESLSDSIEQEQEAALQDNDDVPS